jgi:hypothetical protein
MAQRLNTYDFSKPSNITTQDRMSYPWDQWFDGSIWRIEQGVDFKTHPLMMERIIRTRATARKAKIVIRHEGVANDPFGVIVFRRTDVPMPSNWTVAPTPAATTTNEQFAVVDGPAHTPVTRSKRPVRPS